MPRIAHFGVYGLAVCAITLSSDFAEAQPLPQVQPYYYGAPAKRPDQPVQMQSLASRNADRKSEIEEALQLYTKQSTFQSDKEVGAGLDETCSDGIINEVRFAGFNRDRDIARFLNMLADVNSALLRPRQITEELLTTRARASGAQDTKSATLSHALIQDFKIFGSNYPRDEAGELLKKLNPTKSFDVNKGAVGVIVPTIESELFQTRLDTALQPRCDVYRLDGKECLVSQTNGRNVLVAHGLAFRFCSTHDDAAQIQKQFDALFSGARNDRSQVALLVQTSPSIKSRGRQASTAPEQSTDSPRATNGNNDAPHAPKLNENDINAEHGRSSTLDEVASIPRIVVFDNFSSLNLLPPLSSGASVRKLDRSILQKFLSISAPSGSEESLYDLVRSSNEYSKWLNHNPSGSTEDCSDNDDFHGMRVLSTLLFSLTAISDELRAEGVLLPVPDIWLYPAAEGQSVQFFINEYERTINSLEELSFGIGRTIVNISRGDAEDVRRKVQVTQINDVIQRLNLDVQSSTLFVAAAGQCKYDSAGNCIEDFEFRNDCKRIPICLGSRPDVLNTGFAFGDKLSQHSFRGGQNVVVATRGNDLVPSGKENKEMCLGVGSTYAAPKITVASAVLAAVLDLKQASSIKSIMVGMASPLDIDGQATVFGGNDKPIAGGYINPREISGISAMLRKQKASPGQLCLLNGDWVCGKNAWSSGGKLIVRQSDGKAEVITLQLVGGLDISDLDPLGPTAGIVEMPRSRVMRFVAGKICDAHSLEIQLKPNLKVDICSLRGWRFFRVPL